MHPAKVLLRHAHPPGGLARHEACGQHLAQPVVVHQRLKRGLDDVRGHEGAVRDQALRRVPLHLLVELLPLDLADGPIEGAGAEDQQQLLQALLVVRLALAGLRAEHRHLWFTSF